MGNIIIKQWSVHKDPRGLTLHLHHEQFLISSTLITGQYKTVTTALLHIALDHTKLFKNCI